MSKIKTLIILILIILSFGAGIYFKDDAIRIYNNFNKGVQDFQKTEIGIIMSKAGKEFLSPPPLFANDKANSVVLLKSKVVAETNFQRQENGLPALTENTKLEKAAAIKANDMFENQYFEHVSPSGTDPGKLVQNYGYNYIIAGENLILGNFSGEKEVIDDWMASPGHRANILNNRYTEIGVAVVKGTYKGQEVWIGVQEFGLPLSSCEEPDPVLRNNIDSNKIQLDSLSLQIDAKKNQIENTNQRSAAYSQMIDDFNQMVVLYNSLAEDTKLIIARYNNEVNIFNQCVAGK
jgi:uncharacterized protein YkwD